MRISDWSSDVCSSDLATTLACAAHEADLIFLATPVGAIASTLAALKPCLRDSTLITDAGSTKVNVVAAAREALGDRIRQFIPGHPIAGAAKTGPEDADTALYRHRPVVLTPLP